MIIDARSLPENRIIETDVCIVGGGTSGIALAREFIGGEFHVSLLESGGLHPDKTTQSLYWGENVGHPYYSLDTSRIRYFGGSSNRWFLPMGHDTFGARMRPLDAIDFEERDWIPYSGWPFKKSHLDPFYDRAQAICRIQPSTFETEDWEDPVKTPQLSFVGTDVKTVMFKFGPRDPFTTDYPKEIENATNITAYLHANVVEIETNEQGSLVARLRIVCLPDRKNLFVSARFYILALGALEIPRLMLLSNKRFKDGIGNQNGLVGRFFMEHPHIWAASFFVPSNPNIFNSTGLYNRIHSMNGVAILGKLALSEETLRREKLLNTVAELVPQTMLLSSFYPQFYPRIDSEGVLSLRHLLSALSRGSRPEEFRRHLLNTVTDFPSVLKTIYRNVKRRVLRTLVRKRIRAFRLAVMSEQAPAPDSRVYLAENCDILGQRRIQLDWRLSPVDIESVIRAQEILGNELRRSGFGQLYPVLSKDTPPEHITGGWHHMGTTRMNNNPRKGVVDGNCRVHGLSNLFIAGPSVFPTGGYANPTLTIVALVVRLADHIKCLMR